MNKSAPIKKAAAVAARLNRLPLTAGLFRYSAAQFLVALILLLVAYPFVVELKNGDLIETTLMTALLISAVLAVGGRGRALVLAILLVLPAAGGRWVEHYQPDLVPLWIIPCAEVTFVGFVVAQLLAFILRAPQVNSEVLCAGISAYLLLGLLWTTAYLLVSRLYPNSFSSLHFTGADHSLGKFDALYLSFVSLTCLGCNDITPLSKPARMLMLMEATTGVFYLAILIARLVALYSQRGRSDKAGSAESN
jgi:hypothetical protein